LSVFGSVVLAELGVTSRVVTGNVYAGGHAWIEIVNSKGQVIGLIDSNLTRKFYSDPTKYYKEVLASPIKTTIIAAPQ
jgi:hypothetical protein